MIGEHRWSCLRMFRKLSKYFPVNILSEWQYFYIVLICFHILNLLVITRFKLILRPIADACITKEQQDYVDFDSFFTHTICHECCHGIGPHSITLPSGQKSTVRLVSWFRWYTRILDSPSVITIYLTNVFLLVTLNLFS